MVQLHPHAETRWQRKRAEIFRTAFAPKPRLTVSQWADRYRKLSSVNSAEPGQWNTDRTPYLREIMDAISDPEVMELVLMKSARVGFTDGVLNNMIGYHMHQEPCPLLMVQPTEGDAKKWSQENLSPMLEETPVLRELLGPAKSRSSKSTILAKEFPGGFLGITGATSPRGLRRRAARKVMFDEVDGYEVSAGAEGDPIILGGKRALTFWNRQLIYGSSPTIKNRSRIEKLFALSDKRYYHVACPHCGHRQILRWGGPDKSYGLKWDAIEVGGRKQVVTESIGYLCESSECAALIPERFKYAMVLNGVWVATNPGALKRGYHISALYSLFDGARWEYLIQEWLDSEGDNELRKGFINTVLGETWDEREGDFSTDALARRAEDYGAEVPHGVGILTASVDVQGDRLEMWIIGWGEGEESWLIAHHRINGDPTSAEPWQTVERLRTKQYVHASGATMRVAVTFVDARYQTQSVVEYVRGREGSGVFASFGNEGRSPNPMKRPVKPNKDKIKPWSLSVDSFKDRLFRRLRIERPGPGYMHFCKPNEAGTPDAEFYAQFGREILVTLRERSAAGAFIGRSVYKKVGRNESVDGYVYAHAALMSIPGITEQLGALAKALSEQKPPVLAAAAQPRGRRVISRGIR